MAKKVRLNLRQLNIFACVLSIILALVLYFSVPAAVLMGNDLTVDDVKAGLALNTGWRCLGSPATLFRLHRASHKDGEVGEMRERLQLRCYLEKGDDFASRLQGEDFRSQIDKEFHFGISQALQPAIFDQNLQALSIALYVGGKTVCYFPAVKEWTQCNGQQGCLSGACEHRRWLNSQPLQE